MASEHPVVFLTKSEEAPIGFDLTGAAFVFGPASTAPTESVRMFSGGGSRHRR